MSNSKQTHRLRLSIDVNSLRDHTFRGVIYVHYAAHQQLGIKQQFRTTPPLEVTKPSVEMHFQNSFASYVLEATKEEITDIFNQLNLEVMHQDRMKKDQQIGIVCIDLQQLLQAPIRKTAQSYVRVLDAYFPIDELDADPINRIGTLRCILYLEDLGPADQLQQQEGKAIDEIFGDPALPVQLSGDPTQQKLLLELNSLEHKVIWELETWRKSEEAKFRVQLKQTEYELRVKLQAESKSKEVERERMFKQCLAGIQLQEGKIKQRGGDLQRREQKILTLEEELKQKLFETAKMLKQKDEEMGLLIKRQKDDRLVVEKEKTMIQLKLGDAQGQVSKLEDELHKLRKEMDKSPIAIVKGTLQEKQQEIGELKKELERSNQMKDQYKQYYEKMRDELVRQKKINEDIQQQQQVNALTEIEKLKVELSSMKQQKQQQQLESIDDNRQSNPFKQVLLNEYDQQFMISGNKQTQQQTQQTQQQIQPQQTQPQYKYTQQYKQPIPISIPASMGKYNNNMDQLSDMQRLIQEREQLLNSGEYYEDDPLIIELSRQIEELS